MADSSKKYLSLDGLKTFWAEIKRRLDTINSYLDFLKSTTTGTNSLSSINGNIRLHIIMATTNQTLSFASKPAAGHDIHIIIRYTGTNSNGITITLPHTNSDILLCDPTYTLKPEEYLEINVISDGSFLYYRVA